MTIKLSDISGGGGLPKLAPDLTYPADRFDLSDDTFERITGIDGSAGLTTALSLTGKFYISLIRFQDLTLENITIRLTIDGVIIWDSTFLVGTSAPQNLLGDTPSEVIQCNSSFLLEIATTTDNNCQLYYLARPIL